MLFIKSYFKVILIHRKGKITQIHSNSLGLESNKMAEKHFVEDILCDVLPKQSQKFYEYTWREFIDFTGHDNHNDNDFIQSFHVLHRHFDRHISD